MGNKYTYKQTFEEWCLRNNRQDILDLWDYDKNDVAPSDIPYGTKNRYYFKCPNGIHESTNKRILNITNKPNHQIICKECSYNNDLTGMVFGELTVIEYDSENTKGRNRRWKCQCTCGNVISILETKLKSGQKRICGKNNTHAILKSDICDNEALDVFNPAYLKELRQSPEYYLYRKEVMKKDGYKCIVCGSHKNIEVHHIYPFSSCPHDRLNPSTGICMCYKHHSVGSPISFHSVYGRYNNTPEQLEEYVNFMREQLNIDEHFDVYEFMENIESDNMEIDDSILI